jgi:hypothetical protein
MSILQIASPARTSLAVLAAFQFITSAVCAQEEINNPREAELKRLQNAIWEEEKREDRDRHKIDELNRQCSELYLAINRDNATRLHDAWKTETDPERKSHLAEDLVAAAVHSDQPDLVVEVATNGTFAQKEIKLPAEAERVPLKVLGKFPYSESPYSGGQPEWVVRRMTRTRFELWMPSHGWLFNAAGNVVSEASPPRRDGRGREWFGAFLPDGRWVTTDLWDMDRTLSFFSNTGRLRKEILSTDLVPYRAEAGGDMPALIGWCRCNRDGTGFVLSVGSNGGWGTAWTSWAGKHRILRNVREAWHLCYPRDLEPKGMYTALSIPDDSGSEVLRRFEPAHGSFVGFPQYSSDKVNVVIPDGETFGFWPRSHDPYVVSNRWEAIDPPRDSDRKREAEEKTWFYKADGTFAGWIAAGRIADTAKLDGMLFRDPADRIITVTKMYEPGRSYEFVWSDGTTARPFKIFPDLKRGFFVRAKELMVAAW